MKVYELQGQGIEKLVCVDRPDPEPQENQLLLRMRAVSINYRDWLTVAGEYNPRQKYPLIPLSDGVGEVVQVGRSVSRFAVGDRVSPIFAQSWYAGEAQKRELASTLGGPLDGTLAEYMVVPEESVVRVPEHLSDEEGATLPCAAVTAWSALVVYGRIRAGDTLLVQGTGGVSIFALQFAKMHGARVIVVSRSSSKLAKMAHLGAWQSIDSTRCPDWADTVRTMTEGNGVDHLLDVGGAETLVSSIRAIRPFGTISVVGVLSGRLAPLSVVPILMRNVRLQGIFVGSRAAFESMNRAVTAHAMRPYIDRVFSFSEARQALESLARAEHVGKVCIRVSI